MRLVRVFLVSIIVFVAQLTVAHRISIAGASPDLVVILLVALVLGRRPVYGVVIGFMLGFLQDLGNASFLGMNALSKSVIAYAVCRCGGGIFPESTLFKGVIIFAAALVNDFIILIVTTSFSILEIIYSFFRFSILSALCSTIIGMLVIAIVEALTGRVVHAGAGR